MTKPYRIAPLVIIPVLFIGLIAGAQTRKNNIVINFGPSSGYGYPSRLYSENCNCIPATNLSGDYSVNKVLSVGIYGAYTYTFFKFEDYITPEINYKDVGKGWDIGVRGAFHISPLIIKNERTDIYAAAFIGDAIYSLVYDKKNIYRDSLNQKVSAINVGGILGFRYFITRIIGLYAEGGLSRKFFMSGGISININLTNK